MTRPYTRSLHSDDYTFLEMYSTPLLAFQQRMGDIPHREWHTHRLWEYASILQELDELQVPRAAKILDVGAGGSFFDPYLAFQYPALYLADSMKYGDITSMVEAQRRAYDLALPLFDVDVEHMSFEDGAFDVTMCISTIEHVESHDKAFSELVRVTQPGGLILLTSDYFRDDAHFEQSVSRHLQVTAYCKDLVLSLPQRFPVSFVGETDLDYAGDFVHNYSFCNICLRKAA